MPYEKTTWLDGQTPSIDAEHLNKIEQGIFDNRQLLENAATKSSMADLGNALGMQGWNQLVTPTHIQITQMPTGTAVICTVGYVTGHKYYVAVKGLPSYVYFQTDSVTGMAALYNNDETIVTSTFTAQSAPFIHNGSGEDKTIDAYANIIDLTRLFGAGNEPETTEEYHNAFPLSIYDYYDYPTAITVDGVVEYVNPPMKLGVEYRTTERFQGKPVYKILSTINNVPPDTPNAIAPDWSPSPLTTKIVGGTACVMYQASGHSYPIPLAENKSNNPTVADKDNFVCIAARNDKNDYVFSVNLPASQRETGNVDVFVVIDYIKNTD